VKTGGVLIGSRLERGRGLGRGGGGVMSSVKVIMTAGFLEWHKKILLGNIVWLSLR
jgi:hypothetical protein